LSDLFEFTNHRSAGGIQFFESLSETTTYPIHQQQNSQFLVAKRVGVTGGHPGISLPKTTRKQAAGEVDRCPVTQGARISAVLACCEELSGRST